MPQPGGLRGGQRDGEQTASDTASAGAGMDVRADDAPPFGHVVRVVGPGTFQRLEPEDPALLIGNGARDPVGPIEVTLTDKCVVDRAGSKPGAVDRILHLDHGRSVSLARRSKLDHGSTVSRGGGALPLRLWRRSFVRDYLPGSSLVKMAGAVCT